MIRAFKITLTIDGISTHAAEWVGDSLADIANEVGKSWVITIEPVAEDKVVRNVTNTVVPRGYDAPEPMYVMDADDLHGGYWLEILPPECDTDNENGTLEAP